MVSVPQTTFYDCPECGLRLTNPAQIGGLCPRCLIATAVEHLSTFDHAALCRFGAVGNTPDIAQLNEKLPAYEFLELLGRGGSGWVYRASQRSLNRQVAIKLLHGTAADSLDSSQRFAREAQILARLKHPRIVTIHDYGSLGELQYIVMEYIAGPTLRDVLRGTGAGDNALQIAEHICEAVEHAHSMGVLHRDLKPENVLFDSIDRIDSLKVADFGISRLTGDTEPGFHQTKTGFLVGTPFYAAPEQMSTNGRVDTRADIYSIGVMLYEMLAGELPRGRFAAPSHHRKAPAGADKVVLRCLEGEPEDRYRDVTALRADIRHVISGAAGRRRKSKVAAISIVTAALIACTWWRVSERSNTETVTRQTVAGESQTLPFQPAGESERILTRNRPKQPTMLPISPPNTTVETPGRTVAPPTSQVPTAQPADTLRPQPLPNNPGQQKPIPSPPAKEEDYFEITSVRVYGLSSISLEFRIAGKQLNDGLTLHNGANLVWVIQTSAVHRIDSPFKLDPNSHTVSIADRATLDFHEAWPLEIFIAERWYRPQPGTRRLSNIFRVNAADVRTESPPRTTQSGARAVSAGP